MAIYGKYVTENCNVVLENFNTYINESENFDIITEGLDLNKAKDFLIEGVKKVKEFIIKIGRSIVNFFKNFVSWIKTVGVKTKEKAKLLFDGLVKKEDLPKEFKDKIEQCVIRCYAYGDFYKENKVDLKYSSFDLKSFDNFDEYIDYDEYITKDEKKDNAMVEDQLENFKSVFDNCSGKIKTRIKDLNTKSDLYNFLDKEIFEFVPKVEVCVYTGTNKDFVNKIAIADVDKAMAEMKQSYATFEKVHNESMKNINKLESNVKSLKPSDDSDNEATTKYRVIKHQLSLASKAFNNQFSLITKVFSYFKTLNQRSSSQFTKVYNITIRTNKILKRDVSYSETEPGGTYVKGEEKEDTWTKETIDGIFREIDLTNLATT